MVVRIRLARYGKKKTPYYRVVVAHGEKPRDGRFIEIVGSFDPLKEKDQAEFKAERVKYWLEKGAQPSLTVGQLLKKNKLQ
ncbi:MAG: 30S ribosomal protein S16 [Pseudomonadota bacterium]